MDDPNGIERLRKSTRPEEKAAIRISPRYEPASLPDAILLAKALNAGRIDLLDGRLSPAVETVSAGTGRTITGRVPTLAYFNARLEDLNACDPDGYLAVPGLFDAGGPSWPCAILYDGFRKCCVLGLGLDRSRLVGQILLSAEAEALRKARPLEPPAFPQAPVRSTLGLTG